MQIGVPKVWRFSETPGLLALLAKALVRTMSDAECRGCGLEGDREAVIAAQRQQQAAGGGLADENAFLEHDITIHKRFVHVFRDLEYALQVCCGCYNTLLVVALVGGCGDVC